MVCWEIWLEKNVVIFEDQGNSYIRVVLNSLAPLNSLLENLHSITMNQYPQTIV